MIDIATTHAIVAGDCHGTSTTAYSAFTATDAWTSADTEDAISVWAVLAGTTCQAEIYADLSPLSKESLTATTTDTTKYTTVTIGTSFNSKVLFQLVVTGIVSPYKSIRFRVVGSGANGADTTVDLYLVKRSWVCDR